jgi:RNA polymerase sigma-70 factor (ECF subfamily)
MIYSNKYGDATRLYTAVQNGDEEAFRHFYEGRLLYLVGKIEKLTNNRNEAWDIAQDTFVKLWEQRGLIDPERSLDAFLVAIATNAAYNANKKKQVHARYSHDEQLLLQDTENQSADSKVLAHELQQKIDAIVEAMPPQRREVYLLSREEGLTYKEIAERMNLSYGTINKHMSLALEELRGVLSALFVLFSLH